jgi:uncharacterized cupin superfamily protein
VRHAQRTTSRHVAIEQDRQRTADENSVLGEFVYVLSGQLVLQADMGRVELTAGMAAGFKAGTGNAHRLLNESRSEAVYLEVGDRIQGDEITYPDDDLAARLVGGSWQFAHKDGTPYAQGT